MTKTYLCIKCGEIEVDRRITEAELKECPHCGGKVERVFKPITSIWKTDGAFGKSGG